MEARPDLSDPSYLLEERMISAETLQDRTFRNRVWNAYYDKADRICFPFYGPDNAVVALSFKSTDYGKVIGNKADGIWVSQPTKSNTLPIDKLFIVEHPLNAMAHFEMRHNPEENNLYVSSMGSPAWSQLDLIQKGIDKRQPRQVILSHDRDQPKVIPGKDGREDRIIPAAGDVYDTKLSEYLTHAHPFVILKPETGSDFNDELKAYKRSNFGCQKQAETLPISESEPLLFRLAKVAATYYQTHAYQPTSEDRQLFAQQHPAEPEDVADQPSSALKRFALLRNFPYQVMAYMRSRLKDPEFSLFIQLMEIN